MDSSIYRKLKRRAGSIRAAYQSSDLYSEELRRLADIESKIFEHLEAAYPPLFLRLLRHLYDMPEEFWEMNGRVVGELLAHHNPLPGIERLEEILGERLHYPPPKRVIRHLKRGAEPYIRQMISLNPELKERYRELARLLGIKL